MPTWDPVAIKAWADLLGVSPLVGVILVLLYTEAKKVFAPLAQLITRSTELLELRIAAARRDAPPPR